MYLLGDELWFGSLNASTYFRSVEQQQARHSQPHSIVLPLKGTGSGEDRTCGITPRRVRVDPCVLLHGIGMSHAAWRAVTPHLSSTRRVIAFDIAGFGSTPALPGGTRPTIANLVEALGASLCELQLELPVDIAGNSLGGTMGLEAARRGIARSVVAISPPCLWDTHPTACEVRLQRACDSWRGGSPAR